MVHPEVRSRPMGNTDLLPYKGVQMKQQPTDEDILWCVCEVCGLRIHPLYRIRPGVVTPKTAVS